MMKDKEDFDFDTAAFLAVKGETHHFTSVLFRDQNIVVDIDKKTSVLPLIFDKLV